MNRYVDALDDDKALPTVCGGVLGLAALGPGVVRALLLPRAQSLVARLDATRATGASSSSTMLAVERVLQALVQAAGSYFAERRRMGAEGPWSQTEGKWVEYDERKHADAAAADVEPAPKCLKGAKENANDKTSLSSASGLEELLVPYYAAAAPDAAHCRLFI